MSLSGAFWVTIRAKPRAYSGSWKRGRPSGCSRPRSPFALLLLGQPTLLRRLRMGVFVDLARDALIATRYQLQPMDLAESARYLPHKLALAGRSDPLFAGDALARLHKASLGLPRALDNLARDALIAAAADGKTLVDDACAKRAVAEAISE